MIVINNNVNDEFCISLNEKIKFYCLERWKGFKNFLYYIKLNLFFKRINVDVIYLYYLFIVRFIFLFLLECKLCVIYYDVCNGGNFVNLYRCKRVYVIFNIVKEDIFKWIGLNLEVVFNGVDVSKIRYFIVC